MGTREPTNTKDPLTRSLVLSTAGQFDQLIIF
jgi:hypothetical protein